MQNCNVFRQYQEKDAERLIRDNNLCSECYKTGHIAGSPQCWKINDIRCATCNTQHNSATECPGRVNNFKTRVNIHDRKEENTYNQPREINKVMNVVHDSLRNMENTIMEHVKSFVYQNKKDPRTWKRANLHQTSAEVHHNMMGGANVPINGTLSGRDQRNI